MNRKSTNTPHNYTDLLCIKPKNTQSPKLNRISLKEKPASFVATPRRVQPRAPASRGTSGVATRGGAPVAQRLVPRHSGKGAQRHAWGLLVGLADLWKRWLQVQDRRGFPVFNDHIIVAAHDVSRMINLLCEHQKYSSNIFKPCEGWLPAETPLPPPRIEFAKTSPLEWVVPGVRW